MNIVVDFREPFCRCGHPEKRHWNDGRGCNGWLGYECPCSNFDSGTDSP